jgi:ABC-2 type transport system ATP-binding protein
MLQINNLHFGYPRNPLLLEDISLELRQGHIYGLLGKNGAGKSTLLKNMIGLANPAKGTCRYKDVPVTGRPVTVLEEIYFIPEELFVPSITPARFVANTASFYPKFSQADFYHYLDVLAVDRNGIMDRQSFGQQKKAMIAFGSGYSYQSPADG